MSRILPLALLAIMMAAASAPAAAASTHGGFGVSPVSLDFTNPALLRGQDAEGTLRLQNSYDEAVSVVVTPQGGTASWVSLAEGLEFEVPAKSSRQVTVRLHVPETASNGDYSGLLRIRATNAATPDGSGASITVEVLPAIRARVTGEQIVRFTAEKVTLDDVPPGSPLVVRAEALNLGNVRAQPQMQLVVEDEQGAQVLRETLTGAAIEPKTRQAMELATQGTLEPGLYTARVSIVEAQGGESFPPLAFEVRETAAEPSLQGMPSGALQTVVAEQNGAVGAPLGIRGSFLNDGETTIQSAKLTAEIFLGGKRVGIASGDAMRVPAGEALDLDAFYQPTAAGQHVVKAYVVYDGVRTAVKETTFAVPGDGAAQAPGPSTGDAGAGTAGTGTTGGADGGAADGSGSGVDGVASGDGSGTSMHGADHAETPGPALALMLGTLALVGLAFGRRARR